MAAGGRGEGRKAGRPVRWVLVALLAVAVVGGLPVGRALTASPWERLVDLEVYREAGRSVLAGRPVYAHLTPVPNLLPFTYPPVAAIAAVPLALLPPGVVAVGWTLGQVALLAWVVSVAFRPLLSRLGTARLAVLGLLTGVSCWLVPVADGLRFGQVDVLLVALCLADCAGRWRRVRRGALVGMAAAVKLTPGVFVVHLWLAGRGRAALTAVATAGLLTAGAVIVLPEASLDFWGRALLDSDRLGANAGTSNQSLRGVLLRVGPDGTAGVVLWLVLAAAVAVHGFRVSASAARAGDDERAVAVVGLLAVLLSPVAWIHHLAWVVVAVGALLGDGRSGRRWLLAGSVAAYFAVPVPWIGVGMLVGEGPHWLGRLLQQGYCLGAVVLLALLAAGRPVRRGGPRLLRSPPRLPGR